MKKIIALLAIVFAAHAGFAKDNTNSKVLDAFRQEFGNIEKVEWYKTDHSFVAKFSLNASRVTAHFDEEGNLLATSRNISDTQLPTRVITRLIKKYPGQIIHNIVEYVCEDSTRYVITLENNNAWTVLRAENTGSLSVLDKLIKQ
ncbi:hypothetical protein DLD77_10540 [Chitinophaga alhagiae]|uniref:Beta-lactamase-inhibitor-like PepSY-like domain-containing protein n=1 Tax=Chitinophaga alhagiae TaxID=2203219 RepID=A0ABM6WDK6_9BACT|nr:hypothetical protein [Chitinophaga alhagiae]AWO02101.1 hypothetical protein DLD77_10540 [Chitinophaga alhagiae]